MRDTKILRHKLMAIPRQGNKKPIWRYYEETSLVSVINNERISRTAIRVEFNYPPSQKRHNRYNFAISYPLVPHGGGCGIHVFYFYPSCAGFIDVFFKGVKKKKVNALQTGAIMNKQQLPCLFSHPVMSPLHHLRVEEDHSNR